jgi:hypothetical protein
MSKEEIEDEESSKWSYDGIEEDWDTFDRKMTRRDIWR